jgi:inorganic pyrophosphatase
MSGSPIPLPPPADADFWGCVDMVVAASRLVIDRPRGSRHPRYPQVVYPLDYGYLEGTASMDGGGIDVWRGSAADAAVVGVICTVDLLKGDSEVKILLGCTDAEVDCALRFLNEGWMRGLLFRR